MDKRIWMCERKAELAKMLSEGAETEDLYGRLVTMLTEHYPDVDTAKTMARMIINEVKSMLKEDTLADTLDFYRDEAAGQPLTINIWNITGNSNCSIQVEQPKAAQDASKETGEGKKRKLSFALIKDDALTLNDRIILSYAAKWSWLNWKHKKEGRPHREINVRRFHNATGYREETIKKCLSKLRIRHYLTPEYTLYGKLTNDERCLGFRKLRWIEKDGLNRDIFHAVMESNEKHVKAGWARKAMGVSKRTFYRLSKKTPTDGTTTPTDGTR